MLIVFVTSHHQHTRCAR